jgi:EAL domain-containing protein (putative c-di-GMP-specific phosphodiesterase class I)
MKWHNQFPDFSSRGKLGVEFSFAFQPIVNVFKQEITSFEALIRGPQGEPAESVLEKMIGKDGKRYYNARSYKIIELANHLKLSRQMNINLSASDLYHVDLTMIGAFQSSRYNSISVENVILEITESEDFAEKQVLFNRLRLLQKFGFKTAIDDFGAGYSGLKLLMEYQPNFIKLDRRLITNIHADKVKQSIFLGIRQMCQYLSIEIVAEGVENRSEYIWLKKAGIELFQGYYFAKPAFEALPKVTPQCFETPD